MTTRRISTQNDYPFVPEVPVALKPVAFGVLDIFFVVQGSPAGVFPSSSSSEIGDCIHDLVLIGYSATGAVTEFVFRAQEENRYWDVTFDVPNSSNPGQIGAVYNTDGSECRAVLFYNSDDVVAGSSSVHMEVEPGRAEWHTEVVEALQFYNIDRCGSVEDEEVWIEVLIPASSSSGGLVYPWEDGYNCEVSFEDGVLQFQVYRGAGKGISPDFGNTNLSCESGSSSGTVQSVVIVNGISPVNGDIPLVVSNSLGKQRSTGKVEIVAKT